MINLLLIIIVIFFLSYDISLKLFFYLDILITFILSYFFFKRSKKLAKMLILTNMFILFYFLFPQISFVLTSIFGKQSYLIIILYNVFIAFLFLSMSGYRELFLGDIKNFKIKMFFIILLISLVFGLIFTLVKEPLPAMFKSVTLNGFDSTLFFLLGSSFAVAFSEQSIFSGFLFNVYKNLSTKKDAMVQVSILFLMFHILRFNVLFDYYYSSFGNQFVVYMGIYYLFLFIFMNTCLYFYSFKSKKYSGSFIYPVLIHFFTDFFLFVFTVLGVGF